MSAPHSGAGRRLRRPRAEHDPVGDARRRRRGHAHRQERRVRLRLLEARRDVRPHDARRRAAAVQDHSSSPACASCARRLPPSIRRRAGSRPTPAPTTATFSSSRSAPTTTSRRRPGSRRRTSSTRSPAPTRLRDMLPTFTKGHAIVGVCGAPYKCPPAPSECALMLHDFLTKRGVRGQCDITMVLPLPSPVPPSPETSKALIAAFAEREHHVPAEPARRSRRCRAPGRHARRRGELPYDLFLGVPKHLRPAVVEASGMTDDGWVPVNPRTLETKYPNVYAIGDIANTGTPKAGVFAEGAAQGGRHGACREHPRQRAKASSMPARDRATSSSAAISSAASTSISSPGRSRPARTTSRAWRSARTRPRSAPRRKARWFGL